MKTLLNLMRRNSDAGATSAQSAPELQPELPVRQRVGTANPSLQALQPVRSQLSRDDQNMVGKIEKYYANIGTDKTNRDIVEAAGMDVPADPAPQLDRALRRRASFLLNREAMNYVHDNAQRVLMGSRPNRQQVLLFNAIATSFKSQAEQVGNAAVRDAQQGRRLCPMTLQPAVFTTFLNRNQGLLASITAVCARGPRQRARELPPLLESFAKNYFNSAATAGNVVKLKPDTVQVSLEPGGCSRTAENWRGGLDILLNLDDGGADAFCQARKSGPPASQSDAYFSNQLQGFERHTPAQRLAALYLQMTLDEITVIEERVPMMADKHTDGTVQRQAQATMEEHTYPGFAGFQDDIMDRNTGSNGSRAALLSPLGKLPAVAHQFKRQYGEELLVDPGLRTWAGSSDLYYDMMSLSKPAGRLMLQRAQPNAQALLQTPAFQR